MKTVLKIIVTSIGLLLILTAVAGLLLFTQLDRWAKEAAEGALSHVFPTGVHFETVAFSPVNTTLEIRGFSLSNPEKFREGNALECERLLIDFDPTTLFDESPAIESIFLEGTNIFFRHEIGKGSNIGRIAKRSAERADDPDRMTFTINQLHCEDAKIRFSTNLIPKSNIPLNLVTVHLEDLEDEPPITSKRVASVFLKSLLVETLTLKGLLKPLIRPLQREVDELNGKTDDEEPKETRRERRKRRKEAAGEKAKEDPAAG